MSLERRSTPRHFVGKPASIKVTTETQIREIPVQIVDLSSHCARVAASEPFQPNTEVLLSMEHPLQPQSLVCLPTFFEEMRSDSSKYHYILRFRDLDENQAGTLSDCLKKYDKISDRRAGKALTNGQERRLTKPIFLKCLRYNRVEKLLDKGQFFYLRELQSGSENVVAFKGRKLRNFGSNNYLGLTTHPLVKEAAVKAVQKYGLGAGGSRILCGSLDIHRQLETKLAQFIGGEDCVIFSTGFSTNVGLLSALVSKGDNLYIDNRSHASIIEGCALIGANVSLYRSTNLGYLEKQLKNTNDKMPKLIITEGVFSMDGDIADTGEIYRMAQKYNAALMVDDAHGTGVIGGTGRGTPEHFGLTGKIDIVMGTLSKSLAGIGGFIVASKKIVDFLKHTSRSFMFTTAVAPAVAAGVLKAIEIIETEPGIRARLWKNIQFVKKEFIDMGLNIGSTQSAIIPVIIKDEIKTYQLTKILEDNGVFVSPVAYPGVKRSESRLRVSVMATHTEEDLQCLVDNVKSGCKQAGIIN